MNDIKELLDRLGELGEGDSNTPVGELILQFKGAVEGIVTFFEKGEDIKLSESIQLILNTHTSEDIELPRSFFTDIIELTQDLENQLEASQHEAKDLRTQVQDTKDLWDTIYRLENEVEGLEEENRNLYDSLDRIHESQSP